MVTKGDDTGVLAEGGETYLSTIALLYQLWILAEPYRVVRGLRYRIEWYLEDIS